MPWLGVVLVTTLSLLRPALAEPAESTAPATSRPAIEPERCLVLPATGRGGRSPIVVDPLEHARATGHAIAPTDGQPAIPGEDNPRWRTLNRSANGAFEARELNGGWAFFSIHRDEPATMMLVAAGHALVYVNGVPRAGDPYATGTLRLPVHLQAGENHLLFQVARGQLRLRLEPISATVLLNPDDATLPDLPIGASDFPVLIGMPVLNCTGGPLEVVPTLTCDGSRHEGPTFTIPPLSVRKLPFRGSIKVVGDRPVVLEVAVNVGTTAVRHELRLDPVPPEQARRITFESAVDGSVQYYALLPSSRGERTDNALVLSLHGAAVEAMSQARAYAPKPWAHIVCPTNRRPFGFDWEDWGRLDAMEVLAHASATLRHDPSRVYLTGHSMGGHGAWQLGVHYPGRFAAIGPSAGWISFQSYAAPRGPATTTVTTTSLRALLDHAAITSDTLALKANLEHAGVFILHGDTDDNVPVSEARKMAAELMGFHKDWRIHEQPGAGHWWESSDEPGAECVDFPAMFDFFAARRIPGISERRRVRFTSIRPHAVGFAAIAELDEPGRLADVDLRLDPIRRRLVGTTRNVRRLRIEPPDGAPIDSIELDGQTLPPGNGPGTRHLLRREGIWREVSPDDARSPRSITGFRDVFANRMVFVVGTRGSDEENALAEMLARFHAETWLVRGNGDVEVVADRQFLPSRFRGRNVILYGNADTNSAWSALLDRSPVQVRRDRVQLDSHVFPGEDLACLLVRPSPLPGGDALVGAVSFTGAAGARLAQRLPIFLSGVHYPDFFIASASMLRDGSSGIRATGFFGPEWELRPEDMYLADR